MSAIVHAPYGAHSSPRARPRRKIDRIGRKWLGRRDIGAAATGRFTGT